MIEWHWLAFDDIPARLVRSAVPAPTGFILEQTCLYPDIDGADPLCHHLMGWREIDGKRTLWLTCAACPRREVR
jgi:ElaA protein